MNLGEKVTYLPDSPSQRIADEGLILRCEVGSGVHGMAIEGTDDRDEMGICIEPWETVIGSRSFKNYTFRTQPEGHCSGPGDLDLVVYGLRHYCHLAAGGNPTVLTPLHAPNSSIEYVTEFGAQLREMAPHFASKKAGDKFKGYLHSQRQGLMGLRSGGTRNQGRADIRAKYGFDTKFAAHMVRLGYQGLWYMQTGKIELPIPEPELTWLRELKQGMHTKQEALDLAEHLEHEIEAAQKTADLPDLPDIDYIDAWVADVHREFWGWGSR